MITAEQARRRADKNKKPVALQWGKLEKCIKDAADRGRYEALYCCDEYDESVLEEIIAALSSKGYKVEKTSEGYCTYLNIRF